MTPFRMIKETSLEQWRCDTFWTKEPETIEWIRSFDEKDVFFDVGANVGVYSLYCAAIHPNCTILSFEPHQKNFFRLLDNIKLNGFKNIHPFMYLIGERSGHRDFKDFKDEIGSSGGQMCESGSIGELACFSLDDFIIHGFYSPNPNHIKIDIDGQELKVVCGMKETLKSLQLKSVLVEIEGRNDELIKMFIRNGFSMANRFNGMKNHSSIRRAKEGINVENVIFTRK